MQSGAPAPKRAGGADLETPLVLGVMALRDVPTVRPSMCDSKSRFRADGGATP